MIIHEPRVRDDRDEVSVEAVVEVEQPGAAYPETLFFTFPGSCREYVTSRADGFAAALLPLAMRLGERLEIRGDLSGRLAHGMRDYQRIQSTWNPGFFRCVEVTCDRLRIGESRETLGKVGASFSGGVDSFHTLWTHLPDNEPYPSFRVSHCVMINGFDSDTDLGPTGSFERMRRVYEPMMRRHNLELVVVRTNLLQFIGFMTQKQSFAAFVTAPALVLGRLFSRFYVPSSYKFTLLGMYPDGSHPMFDHLLGTDTMEVIHDGAHLTRVEKTVALSKWTDTYDRLRVCVNTTGVDDETNAIRNCCACEKCLRTMGTLEIVGALKKFVCFPKALERRRIRSLDYRDRGSRIFANEIIDFASRSGRKDMAGDFRQALLRSVWLSRFWRRPPVQRIARASYRLEKRWKPYAAIVTPAKRLLQRLGFGRLMWS
jgi:hypothetical protein